MRLLGILCTLGLLLAPLPTLQAQAGKVAADPYLGNFGDGTGGLTLKKAPKGYTGSFDLQGQSFPLTAAKVGDRVVGTFEAGGSTYMFEAHSANGGLAVTLNGQTFQLARQAVGAAPSLGSAPPPAGRAPGTGGAGGSPQDQQLAQLLLSSPWCSFSYHNGYTNQSRNVFHRDGTLSVNTNAEGGTVNPNGGGSVDIGGGASGSTYGQSQGGGSVQWRVQGGQLYLNAGSGFQAIPLRITQNSNGYPIITSVTDGREYSQCR